MPMIARALQALCLLAAMVCPGLALADGPQFKVDPFWPKPLPNNWILGQVAGVAVDAKQHIWIIHPVGRSPSF